MSRWLRLRVWKSQQELPRKQSRRKSFLLKVPSFLIGAFGPSRILTNTFHKTFRCSFVQIPRHPSPHTFSDIGLIHHSDSRGAGPGPVERHAADERTPRGKRGRCKRPTALSQPASSTVTLRQKGENELSKRPGRWGVKIDLSSISWFWQLLRLSKKMNTEILGGGGGGWFVCVSWNVFWDQFFFCSVVY